MPISFKRPISELRALHNTQLYRTSLPILRRGTSVTLLTPASSLTISLLRAHPDDRHLGPLTSFTVGPRQHNAGFLFNKSQPDGCLLSLTFDVAIGLYEISDGEDSLRFAVLFNPFSHTDRPVQMQSEAERNEYVLNEEGLIWRGSAESNYPAAWDYGQHNPTVLLSAFSFLDNLFPEKRRDVVAVSRHLSAVVNSQDDNGLLMGRWDGDYSDGTPPTAWTGSVPIITEYWRKRRPVRYGQCWVFGALLTSLCRTLGLPCRTVSNFNSAHDTDRPYNRAVDMYFDSDGDLMEHRTSDSIWNFHVWNEAWMQRADLSDLERSEGVSLGGWQVLDATPQERSRRLFQLGPAPVAAIKRGMSLSYDTDFVIGEVNADVLFYRQRNGSPEFALVGKNTRHVGKVISTKAVGSDRRNDVTLEYKFAEGTPEERAALANRPSANLRAMHSLFKMSFELFYPSRVRVGDGIIVSIKATNRGSKAATVHFSSLYRAIRYTGAPVARVGQTKDDVEIAPKQSKLFSVDVPFEQYMSHLEQDAQAIKFINSAKETGGVEFWAQECVVRLYGDDLLQVSAPGVVELNETVHAKATVTNSLRIPLAGVTLRASGEGLVGPTVIPLGTVEPGASADAEIELDPYAVGKHVLVVTLDTIELKDVSKSVHVIVEDNSVSKPWESFLAALARRGDRNWDELLRDI